jgi:hypothetical protein
MDLWLEIIQEMESRRQKGLETYGRPVDASECVLWLKHAEEEFLDGAVYCRAAYKVFDKMQKEIADLKDKISELEEWGEKCLKR